MRAEAHRDVPGAVVVVGSGTEGRSGEGKLGHFAGFRWSAGDHRLAEVFIAGEGLARGPEAVLGTLLHEAAHAAAEVRGISDTSRQGRYHNRHYKALAEELGLSVTERAPFGWSDTALAEGSAHAYRGVIEELGRAMALIRPGEDRPGPRRSTNLVACRCGCPRRIRVARGTLAQGPIRCGICGECFLALDDRCQQ